MGKLREKTLETYKNGPIIGVFASLLEEGLDLRFVDLTGNPRGALQNQQEPNYANESRVYGKCSHEQSTLDCHFQWTEREREIVKGESLDLGPCY